MKKKLLFFSCLIATFCFGQNQNNGKPLPIIDMHLHCIPVASMLMGGMPDRLPSPLKDMGAWDQRDSAVKYFRDISNVGNSLPAAISDEDLRNKTFAILEKYNVYGVTSGSADLLAQWVKLSPKRIIPGVGDLETLSPDRMKKEIQENKLKVFSEITYQYAGMTLSDSSLEPFLKIAEDYDIPVGVHVGPGPPGVAYIFAPNYRARLHSALTVEEALLRHPKLRVFLQHAGWPMIDDLIAVLFTHPQVYVDLAVVCNDLPVEEFHSYLKRIIDAGFEKRVMFGSDQMIWPDAIVKGIEAIQHVPFLTEEQKRDILFNNAARFLRLTDEQIKSMY